MIQEKTSQKAGLGNDIKDAKADLADATKTLSEAKGIRSKENKAYIEFSDQNKKDVASLTAAIAAMKKSTGFLQTQEGAKYAANIKRLVASNVDLSAADRDVMTSFLAVSESDADSSDSDSDSDSSPEVLGILEQMKEDMGKDQASRTTDEKSAVKQFDSLSTSKTSQMDTLKKEIEDKTKRESEMGLELVENKKTLEQTKLTLESDTKTAARLAKEMKARKASFDLTTRTRVEELTAISDTRTILNDDVAGRLFKKTFPIEKTSLLQIQAPIKQLKGEALQALEGAAPKGGADPRVELVALALRSKKTTFGKVVQMIDDMIKLLNQEQKDDADKRQYCQEEIDKTEDEKKEADHKVSDLRKAITQANQKAASLTKDIKSKEDGIAALDKQVAQAT